MDDMYVDNVNTICISLRSTLIDNTDHKTQTKGGF